MKTVVCRRTVTNAEKKIYDQWGERKKGFFGFVVVLWSMKRQQQEYELVREKTCDM